MVRRFLPLLVALAAVIALIVWETSSDSGTPSTSPSTTSPVAVATTTTSTTTTTTTSAPVTATTTGDGALPQTDALPSATSPQFLAGMSALFDAVATGTPADAIGAFFPEAAYVQLKTIDGAAYDWQDRLVAEYDLDIQAATATLGPGAAAATLTSVQVPMQYAHWIPPGVCDNDIGYYEVANSRMVYSVDGTTRSFGIASLISWRGEWYVVHLGAILRPGSGGTVLDPTDGPGVSPPSTTC